jgi:IPT/TIG domain/Autotransporter beta-domain
MGTGKALYTYVTPAPPTLTLVNPFNGSTLGGTSVTITGTSFLGVTSVTFDGLSATGVTVNSAGTTIVATTPAHAAGAVSVAITAPGGMIAGSYTYITLPPGAPPPPTVVSISPASGSTLGGTSVTITGTNFTGTPQLTIGGSAATGVTVVDGTTIKARTPAHAAGLADVMVITTAGTATGTGLYSYATPALPPPPPSPTLSGISPNSGSTAGGTSVTISGTNLSGATVTIGGQPAAGVTVNGSGTSITTTTPPGSLGAANVVVTTPGGTVTGPGLFTYVTLPPTVTAVSPATGSTLGRTSVTITGTNFVQGATVTIGGVMATAVSAFSATTITAITPAGSAGAANVVVTTPAGNSGTTGNNRYTYVTSAVPTVTAIAANSGTTAGGTSVTITGTNFTGATAATIGGSPATFVTVVNATTISAATPAHAAGAVSVTVTTPAGTGTGTSLFTYVAQPPTVSGISPNSGTTLGGAAITITGTNLTGATVTIGGSPATGVTVNGGGTTITATTPAHAIGAVNVVVTTPGGTAAAAGTYLYVPPPPTVTSITPTNSGTTLGGTPVTITGTNFFGATSVTFGGQPATGVTVVDGMTIKATTPAHAAGAVSVVVTTPGGTVTGTNLFTYVTPLPAVSAISPSSGTTAGGTPVTITGANFTGATAVTIGGVPATGVTVNGSGTISATTPAHPPGPASVVVTTPGGTGTATGNYTYVPPTPTPNISSISPSSGTTAGGTSVTISGANLTGATSVTIGGQPATGVTVNGNGTSITAITPAHAAGAANVAVVTPSGTGTGLYTYVTLAAPTVTTISPPDGPVTGGTFITISGTNFVQGATTVTIGGVAVTGLTVVSSTTMTATTPAHAAGSSEVNVTTPGGSDPVSFTYDPLNADSLKLRKLQVAFTPVVAQASGAAISGAVQDAIGAGFSDSTQECTPNGNGFTCHFAGDREEHVAVLERPVRSFDSETDPRMSRVDDAFSALAGAGNVVKTPPRPVVAPQRDWLGWVDFRGTSFSSSGAGDTTSGLQVNATAGLTRKLNPNFLVGILAGYEHFNYTEQAISGRLTGDGWTVGTYLGWRMTPTLRFDALLAGSDIGYAGVAGTASGNYSGERLLASGTLTGTYGWQAMVLEPSAQVYGLLENENQYTDTLGTIQTARSFETGRASSGMKVSLPFAASDSMNLMPFVGLYADYYFTSDNASVTGLNSVPLLQGSSARATGGLAMTFGGGSQVAVDGEYDGIGGNAHVWTYRARGSVPF